MGQLLDPEFPPLLPAGFLDLDVSDLEAQFVTAFPQSRSRPQILARFLILVAYLRGLGLSCTAWLDGSFFTEKVEPDDIDVTLLADNTILGQLTPASLDSVNYLIDNHFETKVRYLCDLYMFDPNNFHQKAYWLGLFGFSRAEIPKGIARVQI